MSILRSSLLNLRTMDMEVQVENDSADESGMENCSGLNFSRSQDKVLVDLVAQQPALWQPSHDNYRDNEVKQRIWKEISIVVGKPVDICKKRWKNIRDAYDRKVKHAGGRIPTKKDGGRWELNQKLRKFLQSPLERSQQATKREKRACNVNSSIYVEEVELDDLLSTDNNHVVGEPETILEEYCASVSSQQLVSYSEKLASGSSTTHGNSKSQSNSSDERQESVPQHIVINSSATACESSSAVDLFFQSMAETVKSFPPRLQQRAKMEALKVINSIEVEIWNSNDNSQIITGK